MLRENESDWLNVYIFWKKSNTRPLASLISIPTLCRYVGAMATYDCANPQSPELGPMQIDYQYIYYCELTGSHHTALFVIFLILWILYLTNVLGGSAEHYFSPTLASICVKLHLSYDFAGVTFLAFGNGAPDVFSSITAFSGGADVLIAVGSLLGGSVFVTTIVVGTIAVLCPCKVSGRSFLRDTLFHTLAATVLCYIGFHRKVNIYMAVLFIFLYLCYAGVVVVAAWIDKRYSQRHNKESPELIMGESSKHGGNKIIQTAFWHSSSTKQSPSPSHKSMPVASSASASKYGKDSRMGNSFFSAHQSSNTGDHGSYKFLILDDHEESKDDSGFHVGDDVDDEGNVTINLSGGLICPELDVPIMDDYFNVKQEETDSLEKSRVKSVAFNDDGGGVELTMGNSLRQSLLGGNKYDGDGDDDIENPGDDSLEDDETDVDTYEIEFNPVTNSGKGDDECSDSDGRGKGTPKRRSSALDSAAVYGNRRNSVVGGSSRGLYGLYWRQLLIRNKKYRRSLLTHEFWDYKWYMKLLAILEFPATVVRDFTIPTVESGRWSKPIAVLQPIIAPIFLLSISGEISAYVKGSKMPVALVVFLVCIAPSIAVYLLSHNSSPPKGALGSVWVLCAFVMCISWIYLCAGELVACLTAAGMIFHVPPAYLGLTVLAWGNCIGDFFSNVSIARRGFGQMALAGCYGGPVFNILVGLGLSLGYACSQQYPEPFEIKFDVSCFVSLVFLYISLTSTLLIVWMRGFQIERGLGFFLITLYGVYTAVQATLVFSGADG